MESYAFWKEEKDARSLDDMSTGDCLLPRRSVLNGDGFDELGLRSGGFAAEYQPQFATVNKGKATHMLLMMIASALEIEEASARIPLPPAPSTPSTQTRECSTHAERRAGRSRSRRESLEVCELNNAVSTLRTSPALPAFPPKHSNTVPPRASCPVLPTRCDSSDPW